MNPIYIERSSTVPAWVVAAFAFARGIGISFNTDGSYRCGLGSHPLVRPLLIAALAKASWYRKCRLSCTRALIAAM